MRPTTSNGLERLGRTAMLGLLAAGMIVLGARNAHAGIDDRERNVRGRIAAGVEDGSLTRGEARRLTREQLRIERKERRLRHNDGRLGPRERRELHRDLTRSARHVHRARHNDRER